MAAGWGRQGAVLHFPGERRTVRARRNLGELDGQGNGRVPADDQPDHHRRQRFHGAAPSPHARDPGGQYGDRVAGGLQ